MQERFIKKYNQIDKSQKLSFLQQLLDKDTQLQEQFLEFIKGKSVDEMVGVDIEKVRQEIYQKLVMIDAEAMFEDYQHCYYDYNDELEGEEIIEEVIEPYYHKMVAYLQKGNALDAFRQLLAMYELSTIEIPEIPDNYCLFGDGFASGVSFVVWEYPSKFVARMEKMVLSVEMKKRLIELLFERHKIMGYRLNHFQSLIILLVDNQAMAVYLLEMLEKDNLYSVQLAWVLLEIATILGDERLFLKVANAFYLEDEEVAKRLLKWHQAKGEDEQFANIAGMLLEKYPQKFSLYIVENLNKEVYSSLYIRALKTHIRQTFSLKHYQALRPYLSLEERLAFIERFGGSYFKAMAFYIDALALEEQYERILVYAQKQESSYQLEKVLKPIVAIYPNEVFEMIQTHCEKLVKERGRDAYARASKLLSLMLEVEEKREELKVYIQKLYNHKPLLPALRDELKKAELIIY